MKRNVHTIRIQTKITNKKKSMTRFKENKVITTKTNLRASNTWRIIFISSVWAERAPLASNINHSLFNKDKIKQHQRNAREREREPHEISEKSIRIKKSRHLNIDFLLVFFRRVPNSERTQWRAESRQNLNFKNGNNERKREPVSDDHPAFWANAIACTKVFHKG